MIRLCMCVLICIFFFSGCEGYTITSPSSSPTNVSEIYPLLPTTVSDNTYYVSAAGDDTNPGTQALPWKTIRKVNSQMANFKPNDSVLFRRGDTWIMNSGGEAGSLVITSNGVTFGPYGSGSLPLFDGSAMTDSGTMSYGMVVITGASNITVDSLDLYNGIKQNLAINDSSSNSNHITIQNCTIRTNRSSGYMLIYISNHGATGTTNNIVIRNNQIYDSRWNGMRITGGVDSVSIYNNTIHDTAHNGIDTYPTGINNTNFLIFSNNIYNFGKEASGAGIYLPGTDNTQIFDNNLHNSLGTSDTYGIKVASESGFVNGNVVARNNRIWSVNTPNSNTYGLWFDKCSNCSVLNNTLYANTSTILDLSNTNLVIKNNLAYANLRDENSMKNYTQDPKFVSAAAADFHLQANSPACSAGINSTFIGAFPCP